MDAKVRLGIGKDAKVRVTSTDAKVQLGMSTDAKVRVGTSTDP